MAESTDDQTRRQAVAGPPGGGIARVEGVDGFDVRTGTIGEALGILAADEPDQPAVTWATSGGPESVSWLDLYDRASRVAATLHEINPHGGRVGLSALNSVDWIVALFAGALAGMSIVPMSASSTEAEAGYQIEHAGVSVVLAAESAGNHRVVDKMRRVAESLDATVVVRDIADAAASHRATPVAVDPGDEFLVQFTSGTTGRPKAASLSHRAVLNCGTVFMRAVGGGRGDRFLNPLPLHHVGGSVTGIVATVAMAGTYVLVERFSPIGTLEALRQTRPTLAGLVPTMMIDLLAMPGVTQADFASLRTVIGGATAVDPGLIAQMEQRLGITIIGSYGQSEAPAMTASTINDSAIVRTQTLGRGLAGRDLCIRDRSGQTVEIDTVGELFVRGPLTMSGYLQADGSVDPAADADGWRATGDLCSMDSDGVITFHGRIREVVIRGGLNVYPAEVEQAISTHESVAEVAVFGVADERLGEVVVAAVIAVPDATVDVAELADLASTQLSSYKRPSHWVVVRALPRTSTGKVRKHLLREWYEAGTLDAECGARGATS